MDESLYIRKIAFCLTLIVGGCRENGGPSRIADQVRWTEGAAGVEPSVAESDTPPEIQSELARIGALQAKGLDGATVHVQRAYISPRDSFRIQEQYRQSHQVVVVDVTFEKFAEAFDLDDVDIINAESDVNYGSDPLLFAVRPDGQVGDINDAGGLSRPAFRHVLLGYSIPKSCRAVRLGYWGKLVTQEAIALEADGVALPKDSE